MTAGENTFIRVDAGICGFDCTIQAAVKEKTTVRLVFSDSACEHIQRLGDRLREVTLKELFMPLSRNPIFVSAERAGCHPACPVPAAVVKAAEVAMGLALPKSARIDFVRPGD